MLITDDSVDFIKTQVEFLEGCYPTLQWDEIMTASAWLITLEGIKATEEELDTAIKSIVKNGLESWQVNIAKIVSLILEDRKSKELRKKSEEYFKEMESKEVITPERFAKVLKDKGVKL